MKYFIDTEFLEGKQKEVFPISLFRKEKPNTIDLISIGVVAEDGREYYAISKDFNLKEAWNRYDLVQESGDMRNMFPNGRKLYWIRKNVLKPIFYELSGKDIDFHDLSASFTYKQMKYLINKYGKTNKEIAENIITFCRHPNSLSYNPPSPEFYAYFADYDWVVFCWLFGKMIDLPKGFPMYCKDLKQMIDDKQSQIDFNTSVTEPRKDIKSHKDFPKQDASKSHNAIEDARWNKQLFEFLTQL